MTVCGTCHESYYGTICHNDVACTVCGDPTHDESGACEVCRTCDRCGETYDDAAKLAAEDGDLLCESCRDDACPRCHGASGSESTTRCPMCSGAWMRGKR